MDLVNQLLAHWQGILAGIGAVVVAASAFMSAVRAVVAAVDKVIVAEVKASISTPTKIDDKFWGFLAKVLNPVVPALDRACAALEWVQPFLERIGWVRSGVQK